ncbi:hypothetical protein MXB_314 [Myxobolus squamalis]|nr:hypothetical protein MXB_314 [Myxobolus squamalis]
MTVHARVDTLISLA